MEHNSNETFQILIAFDVSGSMYLPFVQGSNSLSKSNSLFSTLKKIINNSNQKDKISLGVSLFGCKNSPTCDFLKFLSLLEVQSLPSNHTPVPKEIIDEIMSTSHNYIQRVGLLGFKYGARYLYKYLKNVSEDKCEEIFKIVIRDEQLVRELVNDLPRQTKGTIIGSFETYGLQFGMFLAQFLPNTFDLRDSINEKYDSSVEEEVLNAFSKCYLITDNLYSCENYDWNQPVNLTTMNGNEVLRLFDQKINLIGKYSLMHWFQRYIYGMTPISTAIGECFSKFITNQNSRYKILFLVTDGENNQGSNPYDCIHQYLELDKLKNVIIVSCFFSSEKLDNPRKLYYTKPKNVSSFCEKLFNVSSILPVDAPGFKTLSEKYGWELPKERACHLFFQVNHPDIIEEFSKVLTDIIDETNPFLRTFSSVFVDIIRSDQLIKQGSFDQQGPTCYAYSSSGAIQLALCRIYSREIPSFQEILSRMLSDWPAGNDGQNVNRVLRNQCPKYKLHVKFLKNEQEARLSLALGRVCVATFYLPKKGWDKFSDFFTNNPQGILRRSDLLQPDGTLGNPNEKGFGGHAVILIDANISALEFLNSWGAGWANNGRFRVENEKVLEMKFYDIYWTLDDLSDQEKENYQRCVEETSKAIERNDNDSSRFAALYFCCPNCQELIRNDDVSTASHSFLCSKCNKLFSPKNARLLRGIYKSEK